MDLDPPSSSAAAAGGDGGGGGDVWPFDSLTTSLFFSPVSASPPPPPLPTASSSWLTPPSPLWLFDDRQLLPLEVGPAPAVAAPEAVVAAVVAEEGHRTLSGNWDTTSKRVKQINSKWKFHLSLDDDSTARLASSTQNRSCFG